KQFMIMHQSLTQPFSTTRSVQKACKTFTFLAGLLLTFSQVQAQVPVVYYDFQSSTTKYNSSNNKEVYSPNQSMHTGTNISGSGGLVLKGADGAAKALYTPATALTGVALNAEGWTAVSDPGTSPSQYLSFDVSTLGLEKISLKLDARTGNKGPYKFGLLY